MGHDPHGAPRRTDLAAESVVALRPGAGTILRRWPASSKPHPPIGVRAMKLAVGVRVGLATALMSGAAALSGPAAAQDRTPGPGTLTRVASFAHQVTGITVSRDGRLFVNFPRWSEDAPVSVAE